MANSRIEEYLEAILAKLADGTDTSVPAPSWNIEKYLAAIYEACGAGLPSTTSADNGKVLAVENGEPAFAYPADEVVNIVIPNEYPLDIGLNNFNNIILDENTSKQIARIFNAQRGQIVIWLHYDDGLDFTWYKCVDAIRRGTITMSNGSITVQGSPFIDAHCLGNNDMVSYVDYLQVDFSKNTDTTLKINIEAYYVEV